MSPKYSFVLPAYKVTFFHEAIDSILNQTYKDFELIIVNDASPDDLTSIINGYHDGRIQYYVNEKNIGGTDLVAQWNHCITYATGDYLILASDDDIYHSDYLEKMDVLINKYPKINVFRPRVYSIDSKGNIIGKSTLLDEYLSQIDFLYLKHLGKVSSGIPFYIFNRKELIKIGGFINFSTAWFSDDATVIRISEGGIVTHRDILFSFRYSGLNISTIRNDNQMLLKKLSATESFYLWYAEVLKTINTPNKGYKAKRDLLISYQRKEMLNSMSWVIGCSDKKTILSSWNLMKNIKSLKKNERLFIFLRVIWNKFIDMIRQ